MRIRVFGSTTMHRLGERRDDDDRIGFTACGIRFCWMDWPRDVARPPLPNCTGCRR